MIKFTQLSAFILSMGCAGLSLGETDPAAPEKAPATFAAASGEKSSASGGEVSLEEVATLYSELTKKEHTAESIKSVQQLYFSKKRLSDETMEKISYMPGVLVLNLGATKGLTPACLPSLARMTSVRVVDLVNVKLIKDVDILIETFKDYKNLQMLSTNRLDEVMKTEKYQEFLKSHPGIVVINGPYTTTRPEHKTTMEKLAESWVNEGIITKEDYRGLKGIAKPGKFK